MTPFIRKYLNQLIAEKTGLSISSLEFEAVGGGSINETYKVRTGDRMNFFLKINSAEKYPGLFEKEKNGLEFIAKQKIIRVPAVVACEEMDGRQLLVLEWIETGLKTREFWKEFGERLAGLHSVSQSHFGFEENNYMGALPQLNDQHEHWVDFFNHCRLQPQIDIAVRKNLLSSRDVLAFENLYPQLSAIFDEEKPSLLHGDLWSGNFICDENSRPVLIDPAVYFGNRHVDLAMTTLFGGFDKTFYEAYDLHFPLPANHKEQWDICNLYPLLIHLNLFGSSYLSEIKNTLFKYS